MAMVDMIELGRRQLFRRHVHLIRHAREEVAVGPDVILTALQANPPEQVLHLDRREPPEHEQRFAGAHIESAMEVVIDAGKVRQQHTSRLQDANAVIQRGVDVEDEVHGERIDETVVGVGRHMIGTAEIRDDRDVVAVLCHVDSVSLSHRGPTVTAGGQRGSDLEAVSSNVGPMRLQKPIPVVADDRLPARSAVGQRAQSAQLKSAQSANDRQTQHCRPAGSRQPTRLAESPTDSCESPHQTARGGRALYYRKAP